MEAETAQETPDTPSEVASLLPNPAKECPMSARRDHDKRRRQAEHEERLETWRKLTPQQQRLELDRRLGPGVGAQRQRLKLMIPSSTSS